MNRTLATAISVVAHPVFINLICLLALFGLFPSLRHGLPERVQYLNILFIFITTSIIPLVLVVFMRLTGRVKSLLLDSPGERHLPYLFTLAFYVFDFYNFYRTPGTHPLVLRYLLACSGIMLAVLTVNYFTKISIHLTTLGAFAGLLVLAGLTGEMEVRPLLIIAIALSGLTATARLSLSAHQPGQVYSGFILGFILMLGLMHVPIPFV